MNAPLVKQKLYSRFFSIFMVLLPAFCFASLSESELIEALREETANLDGNMETPTSSLLPFAETNQWRFIYSDIFEGLDSPLVASLGSTENLGDICLRPLVFGENKQLELFLANYQNRLVFYGFRAILDGESQSFFFKQNDVLGINAGVNLSFLAGEDFAQEQAGQQLGSINGQEVTLTWLARNIEVTNEMNAVTFDGTVAGGAVSLSPDAFKKVEFDVFIKPCELAQGCYLSSFSFSFLPEIGLKAFELRGDNESYGGQFHYRYSLDDTVMESFVLESSSNQLPFFPCEAQENTNNISKTSLGLFSIWINISLVFVVLLRLVFTATPYIRSDRRSSHQK